jgi:predicted Abi (CAAX) family protease
VWRKRLTRALARPGSSRAWIEAGVLWLVFVALVAPLALSMELLPGRVGLDGPRVALRLFVLPLLIPALAEEIFFRALLYPHPDEPVPRCSRFGWAALSLLGYVVAHPLNGWLLRPVAREIFFDERFLIIVLLLGAATLVSYHRAGSLWPAVAMHYLTVVLWLSFGGLALLAGAPAS